MGRYFDNNMSNNPFETHGIEYLSASQINQYITNPARWILTVSGFRDNFGSPAMWRGIAVDQATTESLYKDISIKRIQNLAKNIFDDKMYEADQQGILYDKTKASKERDALQIYIDVAVPYFRELGTPIATQKKIKLEFDELPIPIIGYLDLQYEGIVRDIKTVNRMSSVIPASTCRQLAIYAHAEKCKPIIDYVYVTSKTQEVKSVTVPNLDGYLNEVKRAASNMMNLLSFSDDIVNVADLVFPNFDAWDWSENEKEAARKLWRI